MQITDRKKDLIKRKGEWISSVDMENLVLAHPGVLEAAVVGRVDDVRDEVPVVFVVAKTRPESTRQGARNHRFDRHQVRLVAVAQAGGHSLRRVASQDRRGQAGQEGDSQDAGRAVANLLTRHSCLTAIDALATVTDATSRAMTRATDSRWRPIMFSALLVCVACLGSEPANLAAAGSPSNAPALAAYQQAREKVGRDADAHVRLALWCENHGLSSERLKHLTIAVLTDPAHARARGLLGLVAFRGRWQSPEEIRKKLQADEASSASLAEYKARRARMRNSADAHLKIAIWCEEHGLKPEATAHLTVATQLDPGLDAAWKRLGYKKHGSRWITDPQLAERKAESEARSKADKYWTTVLARLRSGLEDESKRAEAAKTLQGITDPSAVPAVWAIFAGGNMSHQRLAVQLFGQIDSPGSTRALSVLAVASESGEVRGKSIETLRRRDPRKSRLSWLGFCATSSSIGSDSLPLSIAAGRLGRDRLDRLPVRPGPVLRYFPDLHRR